MRSLPFRDFRYLLAAAIAATPIILWELSLGIWLVTKGFRPQAIAELGTVTNDPINVHAQPAT